MHRQEWQRALVHRHTLLGADRGHAPFHPDPVIQVDTYRNGVEESHVRRIGTKHSGQAQAAHALFGEDGVTQV